VEETLKKAKMNGNEYYHFNQDIDDYFNYEHDVDIHYYYDMLRVDEYVKYYGGWL
jgi:hypothetical protein